MMQIRLLLVGMLVLASATAHAADRRGFQPQLPFQLNSELFQEDALILKFIDEVPVRLEAGRLRLGQVAFLAANELQQIEDVLAGTTMERLFSRSVADLDAEREWILADLPAGRTPPADLNNYYRVHTSGLEHTEQLVNDLYPMSLVQNAYPEPSPDAIVMTGSVDIAPTTGNFESSQGYLDAAPSGLGWNDLRNIVGAQGPDLTVCHMEGSWHFDHEDACEMTTANVVGALPDSSWDSWKDHGSACVGIMTADRNAWGVRGMASQSGLILSSLQNGGADGISIATGALNPGDVMSSSWAWVIPEHAPLDFFQAEWDAVNTASLSGISYQYAAGNSDAELDNTAIYGDIYLPGAPDNGGFIIGASNSADLDKIWFSNFGTRVDAHAWGENIETLGYGDRFLPAGDSAQSYTAVFGGTSGATPSVSGIVAALTNAVLEQNNVLLTPFEIRDKLRNTGTPQGAGGNIGNRPDLATLLAEFGLPDGLELKGDGAIGGEFTLEISGEPNSPFILFLSASRGRATTNINRDWLIDLTSFVKVAGLSTDGLGEANIVGEFPDEPGLIDSSVFFQLLNLDDLGNLHLTNSVELWVRE